MTQVLASVPHTASSGTEHDLLQKLIAEGLSTGTDGQVDPAQYQKLVKVLFQACILNPSAQAQAPSPSASEQAGLTLTILARQTTSRPDLLAAVPPPPEHQTPLYKWVLPRLIYAAVKNVEQRRPGALVNQLEDAAVGVLITLGRDFSDEQTSYARGPRRAIMAMEHMSNFCQGIIDDNPVNLFGFPDLKASTVAALTTVHILVRAQAAFTYHILQKAGAQLARLARRVRNDAGLQTRFLTVLTSALWLAPTGGDLGVSVREALTWETSVDRQWQEAFGNFMESLARAGDLVRCDAWWTLQPRVDSLEPTDDAFRAIIIYLLTPIDPLLPHSAISALLGAHLLDRWLEQAKQNGGTQKEEIERLVGQLRGAEPSSTKKRKRDEKDRAEELKETLRYEYPDVKVEDGAGLGQIVFSIARSGAPHLVKVGAVFADTCCAAAACASRPHHAVGDLDGFVDAWVTLRKAGAFASELVALRNLLSVFEHMEAAALATALQMQKGRAAMEVIWGGLKSPDRRLRLAAGRVLILAYAAQNSHPDPKVGAKNRRDHRRRIARQLDEASINIRETAVLVLGHMGRASTDEELCSVLESLIQQLGSSSAPLRSLAYAELLDLARYNNKTPYTLLSPHLERISVLLAESLVRSPETVAETMHFIGYTRQNFIETTLQFTLPSLVMSQDREALGMLASIVKRSLGPILLDNIAQILAKVFLDPAQTEPSLNFLVSMLKRFTRDQSGIEVSAGSLMTACIVPFIVTLVVELGDEDPKVVRNAKLALQNAQKQQHSEAGLMDLGTFLKPHMLGIISHLNDTLHDIQGKKTVEYKRKIIRSMGALIDLVGNSMTSFSPQIMASLQSTLDITELREETLKTWFLFVQKLRFADVGPFVGRTTGALVAQWHTFNHDEKDVAVRIINEIAGNSRELSAYLDEMVGLDGIPELREAAKQLTDYRKKWTVREHIRRLHDRVNSKNVAMATTSMREVRALLVGHHNEITQLSRGDSFDAIISQLMDSLLSAATRDGDAQELRDLAYECLGILGALDPDRFVPIPEPPPIMLERNFADNEENQTFAIHLIRNILVGAFRATNDTKHQNHLAFAIQELLKFCGFDTKILQPSAPKALKQKWNALPKDQLETLTPLLGSRFTITEASAKEYEHPIYTRAPTYREWLQMWTTDLINKVMSQSVDSQAVHASQTIFGVFRGVLRGQDVTVAHHILPHLVLNVLLSGHPTAQAEICQEINTVLQDQVNPSGHVDKRTLSAQVIFDLMDHLSKWLRLARSDEARKKKVVDSRSNNNRLATATLAELQREIALVDTVLSSIETELMANAALQSRAYARSLRNFEQRIVQLRKEKRDTADMQTYFERLHQIYAELDEPDGMEGVSTFVISPSLEHQIREHESTGRWTSAQSCWEVRLQQSPEDVSLHVGLLKCLRNLGHYDTLRTHIRGLLSRRPDWQEELAPFEAEAAWIIGDWETVKSVGARAPPVGQALLALHDNADISSIMVAARQQVGRAITSKQYPRAYDPVLQLHLLREVELVHSADLAISTTRDTNNERAIKQQHARSLVRTLDERFSTASPSFRVREAILTIRRTAFGIAQSPLINTQIGHAWIQTSKIARKSGYEQTAYSATLQAKEVDAPFAFVQQAKLLRASGGAWKALTDLENMMNPMLKREDEQKRGVGVVDMTREKTEEDFQRDRSLAKAVLLEARWANETDRFETNEVLERYKKAITLAPSLESPYYHLGHYYDSLASQTDQAALLNQNTCHNYYMALQYGVKYIYQTMPRMLTLWLDLGELKDLKKNAEAVAALGKITAIMEKARKELPAYQFLTAYPQIVSRMGHPHAQVAHTLRKIMATVIQRYPQQSLWPTVGVMQSNRPERKATAAAVLAKASQGDPGVTSLVRDAERLSGILLRLAEDKADEKEKRREFNAATDFPYTQGAFPSRMIMPLQDAMTCTLPSTADTVKTHNPFPGTPVEILKLVDRIDVMPSLQKPKKLVFEGTDGRKYPFLCKPHDDLRKDARLMDFNSMINKLLKSATESRRRQLYIRTYAVMPLNEECGLLEWVSNTVALKSILEQGYARHGKRVYTSGLGQKLESAKKEGFAAQIDTFKRKILPEYKPTVFHEWFLMTWPEPSAWLASRMAYARTLAVMSMIGHVLGLGDRHGENILFDTLTGDTLHVDFNCLFDKGKTFEIPERVPFRMTHNMVDALGVTGVEGLFRKAAEIGMEVLRNNSDSLMSVLEAFAHDPLVEWAKHGRAKSEKDIRSLADRNLKPIRNKLSGKLDDGTMASVPNQVEALIKAATSPNNLGLMYMGWAPWL